MIEEILDKFDEDIILSIQNKIKNHKDEILKYK